jgi:hypothetical protein
MLYDRFEQHNYYLDCFKLVKKFQRKFIIFFNQETKLSLPATQFNKSHQNKENICRLPFVYPIPNKSGSNCPRGWVCNKSNTTSATCGAGMAYPSGAPEFTPGF